MLPRAVFDYAKLLCRIEGLSLLFLLFVAMPIRKITGDPSIVRSAGAVHGILFLMMAFSLDSLRREKVFSGRFFFASLVMGSVPFGTYWVVKRMEGFGETPPSPIENADGRFGRG